MSDRHYISEGDYETWSGCLVRVPGRPQRLFSYRDYDRRNECLAAARAFRDAEIQAIGGWARLPVRVGGKNHITHVPARPLSRNKLQILGVHEDKRYRGRKLKEWTFVAQLRSIDFEGRATFSAMRLGRERALEAAKATRRMFERERDRNAAARKAKQ